MQITHTGAAESPVVPVANDTDGEWCPTSSLRHNTSLNKALNPKLSLMLVNSEHAYRNLHQRMGNLQTERIDLIFQLLFLQNNSMFLLSGICTF